MTTHRLYYDDSFVREFSAHVRGSEPAVHGNAPAWRVVLDQTAFYPTSGGQPHDLGCIAGVPVVEVSDDGDEIVHLVHQHIAHEKVACSIDWPRRFDHMQQHTGQHLLSAMFLERFGRQTISFHLGTDLSTIDLRGPEPTDEMLEGAERAANDIIFEDRPVTVRYGTAEDLARLGVRKEIDREGLLRAIEIAGADLQPCGGTHVKSTGQIGTLLVRRCTKIRQDWRVEFACGARAARLARRDFLLVRAAAEKLGCSSEELTPAVERVLAERDAQSKKTRGLLQRLAEMDAAQAVREATADAEGRVIVQRLCEDADPAYLGFFATEVAKANKAVALLANGEGHLILAQHPAAALDMNALIKHIFAQFPGKGGGSRDFARGRLAEAKQAASALHHAGQALHLARSA